MNLYMTAGTYEFLKKIATKHSGELLITMINENGALLLHETAGDTFFQQPRKYEVLERSGDLKKEGVVVMNNIPVKDDGRPVFEHQFKNRSGKAENSPGFIAFRFLRPKSSNTYVVMTVWENEDYYQKWQNSISFIESHKNSKGSNVFVSAPYTSKYLITE